MIPHQFDAQYLYEGASFNLVTGASYSDSDSVDTIESITSYEIPPVVPPTIDPPLIIDTDSITTDKRIYAYTDWAVMPSVTGTIGLSYVNFESSVTDFDKLDFDEFNPKLGIRWNITDSGSGGTEMGGGGNATATSDDGRYLKFNAGGGGVVAHFDACVWPSQPDDDHCPQSNND